MHVQVNTAAIESKFRNIHLTDDTSISQQLKYPDQLDPEDVTTPAPFHVLQEEKAA